MPPTGPTRAPGVMRRLLPTVAMVAAVAVCIAAGNWQRGRMSQKEALGERLAAAAVAPLVPLPADVGDWSTWRFRRVELAGRYDAPRQIMIDNKVHAGRAGYHVVTPLVLTDGRAGCECGDGAAVIHAQRVSGLCRKAGIELVGVGIRDDSLRAIVADTIVVHELKDLPAQLCKLLGRTLKKGLRHVG